MERWSMNPHSKKPVPSSPGEWISHAESDLKLAQLAVGDPDIRAGQVCFHAQQAAEKAIKAVLLSREVEFPLTHDLEELVEIAEGSGLRLPEDITQVGLLTPYAVETRYPGYWAEITQADVDEAIRLAAQTVSWAKSVLMEGKGDDS